MDLEFELEQDYLRQVRNFLEESEKNRLTEMTTLKQKLDRLFKESGGTFSQDYELAKASLKLAQTRQGKSQEAMEKPFFGRIDFREKLSLKPERLYIGRHAVRDNDSVTDFVIDWRSPAAELYYSGTLGRSEYHAPGGFIQGDLSVKRRYTYTKDTVPMIERYFDEGDQILVSSEQGEGKTLQDEFLRISLEEASSEKMKDIVATIAREQNKIIRAPKNIPLIVQGAAGTGKTAVALHRLAYLLYLHRESMTGQDVCIIAPSRMFLDYISDVLPDLGTTDVIQTTLEDLMRKELKIRQSVRHKEEVLQSILEGEPETARKEAAISRLKGSRAYMKLIQAMVREKETELCDRGPILIEGEVLYTAEEIRRLFTKDLLYLPLNERRAKIQTYCLRNVQMRAQKAGLYIERRFAGEIGRIKEAFRDNKALLREKITACYDQRDAVLKNLKTAARTKIKEYFKAFAQESALSLYERLLGREGFVQQHLPGAGEHLSDLTGFSRTDIRAEDLAACMYLSLLLDGTSRRWSHIVVDEAQDYTLLELEVIRLLARQDSITLVGDLAQGIYSYRAFASWEEAAALFADGAVHYQLKNSYRSTIEIMEEAARTLRRMEIGVEEAVPVFRRGRRPKRALYQGKEELLGILHGIDEVMAQDCRTTMALVTRTWSEAEAFYKLLKGSLPELELAGEDTASGHLKKVLMPSYLTKGLEFDCVVLLDESSFSGSTLDLRLKYVSLTRARHLEFILSRANA